MIATAIVLAALAAAGLVLRCTVLATSSGRHQLQRTHPGWEANPEQLTWLASQPNRHTQVPHA